MAIGTRISAYGITEERYWVLVLGSWLLAMAGYFIFSKEKNIKVIPITLALIASLSSFGIWGAYSVASRSQKAQLEVIFAKNKMLKNGMFDNALSVVLENEERNRVRSIVDFFADRNNIEALQPIFSKEIIVKKNVDEGAISSSHYQNRENQKNAVFDAMGMPEAENAGYTTISRIYLNNPNKVFSTKGYDYVLPNIQYAQKTMLKPNIEAEIALIETEKDAKYNFTVDKKTIEMNFEPYFEKLLKNSKINTETNNQELSEYEDVYFENEHLKVKVIINNMYIRYDKKQQFTKVDNLVFDLLFSIK